MRKQPAPSNSYELTPKEEHHGNDVAVRAMSNSATAFRFVAVLLLALQLAACDRNIQWEEEVPLNTGETIWIKRKVVYALQGAAGNPLDIAYRPRFAETFSFEWHGRQYSYTGTADAMLLAISPQTQAPVLVAAASSKGWDWDNNYRCTTPFYVQLIPDSSGYNWMWPPAIEPWLYGMSYNIMKHNPKPQEVQPRYSVQDRAVKDSELLAEKQISWLTRIDPTHQSKDCKK